MATTLLYNLLRRVALMSPIVVFLAALCLLIIVGVLDYLTGYEFRLYAFYFPSVAIVSWTGNRRLSTSIVLLATLILYGVNLVMGGTYSHEIFRYCTASYWLFSFYVIAEMGLGARELYDNGQQTNEQLRQTTEKLERNSSELAAIMDAVPAAIYVAHDVDCRRISGNRYAHELLGLPLSSNFSRTAQPDVVPTGYRVVKDGKEVPSEQLPIQKAARGEVQRACKFDLVFDDGAVKSFLGDAAPLLDSDGHSIGAVGAFLDVTDRITIEQEMEKSRAILRAALASMPDTFYISDLQGNAIELSDNFAAFHRFNSREECPTDLDELLKVFELQTFAGVPVPLDLWPLSRALRGESASNAEYVICRKDLGESWMASYSFAPIYNGDGAIMGAVLSIREVSELKRLQEERIVLERQILNTRRLECLAVLAGGIAHDFNNLLQVIQGHTELVSGALSSDSPFHSNLRSIQTATNRAASLARHMLNYSGHGHFRLLPIDLNEVVRESLKNVHDVIPANVAFRTDIADDPAMVQGDMDQVCQIAVSLITNALESIGDNEGSIRLSTRTTFCDRIYLDRLVESHQMCIFEPLTEGTYVYLEVSDTGTGMDGETMGRIFDPFFTTKFPGRGLGLSSALGVMWGHRGGIAVESKIGVGSTFQLLFPVDNSSHHPRCS